MRGGEGAGVGCRGGELGGYRASEFKSEDLGFDPLAGQGGTVSFSVLPSQLLCRLVCVCFPPPPPPPSSPSCVRPAPKFVRTLKIQYSSVVKQ